MTRQNRGLLKAIGLSCLALLAGAGPATQPTTTAAMPTGLTAGQWALAQAILAYRGDTRDEIEKDRQMLGAMQRGRINPRQGGALKREGNGFSFTSEDVKRSWVNRQMGKLKGDQDRLKKLEAGEVVPPDLFCNELSVGKVGAIRIPSNLANGGQGYEVAANIVQVNSDHEAIVRVYDQLVWLRGYPTNGLVDDAAVMLTGPHFVAGTKTYGAVAGKRTVFVLEPVSTNGVKDAIEFLRAGGNPPPGGLLRGSP
jgi:hypothetical protein